MTSLKLQYLLLLAGVCLTVVQGEQCGSSNCASYQVCEEKENGGTCYNSTLRTECDALFYCYKPTLCCGVGTCCPENSECCGFNTCCPKGAVCCGPPFICCEAGSTCCGYNRCCASGGNSKSGGVKWYYVMLVLIPLIAVAILIARLRRRNARMRAAGLSGTVVMAPPAEQHPQNPSHYGYNQPLPANQYAPYPSYPSTAPYTDQTSMETGNSTSVNNAPPAYHEVVNT